MSEKNKYKPTKLMVLPREIVIGHDALLEIGNVCKRLMLASPGLIVADDTTIKIAGTIVKDTLATIGVSTDSILITDASKSEVDRVRAHINTKGTKIVLGVGGGRPIDVAKCASYECNIPFISVPTAASHDGIVSFQASILVDGEKKSIYTHAPLAVVADTKVIASAPYRLLAAGCGDIISNHTAVRDWELAKRLRNEDYSSYAAALSEMTAQIIEKNATMIRRGLEESARLVTKALVSSGVAMSIAGSSRPASGSEHMFSHALDKIAPKPALHGEQCAIGTIMMLYLHGGDWESIRFALKKIGLPITARQLKIDDKIIIDALMIAHKMKPERYTILGSGLTREAAIDIAKTTKVISETAEL